MNHIYSVVNCDEANTIKDKYDKLCHQKNNLVLAQDICMANDIPLLPVFMSYFKINSISPSSHDFLGNVTYDKYFQFVVLFTFLDVSNIIHGINYFFLIHK